MYTSHASEHGEFTQKNIIMKYQDQRQTHNKTMKIIVAAITFEPEVVESSGWQINPWRNTYRDVISILICEAPFCVTWRHNITFVLTK